jgi:hypothetical protein
MMDTWVQTAGQWLSDDTNGKSRGTESTVQQHKKIPQDQGLVGYSNASGGAQCSSYVRLRQHQMHAFQ